MNSGLRRQEDIRNLPSGFAARALAQSLSLRGRSASLANCSCDAATEMACGSVDVSGPGARAKREPLRSLAIFDRPSTQGGIAWASCCRPPQGELLEDARRAKARAYRNANTPADARTRIAVRLHGSVRMRGAPGAPCCGPDDDHDCVKGKTGQKQEYLRTPAYSGVNKENGMATFISLFGGILVFTILAYVLAKGGK